MKALHVMLMALVLSLLAATACAQSPANNHSTSVHLTTNWVATFDPDTLQPLVPWQHWIGSCTGTKKSLHIIITDEHCLEHVPAKNGRMKVDGVWGHVMKVWLDGHDHALVAMDLNLKGPYVMLATGPVTQGDTVYWFGNPDWLVDMLRRGYVAGFLHDDDNTIVLDANGFNGDSGSGVFNDRGEMIATINQIHSYEFHLMYAFPLQFTPQQYAEAESWPHS